MAAEIALPQGYALHEYRVEQTLGIGGFGLTYLATDSNLNLKVAIKEYLPGDLAQRGDDQSVRPKSESTSESFKWGLSRFLDESRTLASFRHPNIVRVLRFFEANSTAYMVMEFVAGQPLGEWIRSRRPLEESAVLAIAGPLLDGLDVIHRTGYLHRDIKPGNVFIRDDGSPVLLDFGSARAASSGIERTAIVTPGYAPIEQYHSHGQQGPWSDLYAFGGVLYWMIVGKRPVEAVARVRQDMLPPAVQTADRTRYSAELLTAVDWALVSHEEKRPQSVSEFRSALSGLAVPDPKTATDLKTRTQDLRQASAPPTTLPTGVAFDRDTLKRIEAELAKHIGPIAPVVIRAAAKKAYTIAGLAEMVSADIADDKERAAFVRRFAGDRSTPTGDTTPAGATRQQSVPPPASNIDAQTLAKAEAALARYIGAVAKVVVKRAAAKARDPGELYLLIAEEIEDKNERKTFIRKAISASGKE
ncbi:MAG TPA: serine/threonine-protein kinase [Burkholderiales bacterium]|jgi:serine/threonine protein kinase|nr:serine/threonine-protein kinase [Burkholderiales bacterium]